MTSNYTPLHHIWSSEELLSKIDKRQILLSSADLAKYYNHLFNQLQAESDSSNLYKELLLNHSISNDLRKFLDVWYPEELNHAEGFYKMLNIFFEEKVQDVKRRIESNHKESDFKRLQTFINDEFKLCVLFAYDEYATLMDYKKMSFYKLVGPPELVEWVTKVMKDEARHFVNLVKLIHHNYQNRTHETADVLNQILDIERSLKDYHFTFLLDHPHRDFLVSYKELENVCAKRVLKSIINH